MVLALCRRGLARTVYLRVLALDREVQVKQKRFNLKLGEVIPLVSFANRNREI